eukprot:g4377.t1
MLIILLSLRGTMSFATDKPYLPKRPAAVTLAARLPGLTVASGQNLDLQLLILALSLVCQVKLRYTDFITLISPFQTGWVLASTRDTIILISTFLPAPYALIDVVYGFDQLFFLSIGLTCI